MMKLARSATAGVLILGLGNVALAMPPCQERPTPPPCCADGHGISRPATFGVYDTHWRPWPIQNGGPTTPQTGEEALKGVLPRADLPPAEEEDRKAPPPTSPPDTAPSRVSGGTNNATPGTETKTAPNGPARQPGDMGEPTAPRRALPPYEPQAPGGARPNSTGPTGEYDPPPSLPFGPGAIQKTAPVREASRLPALQPPRIERPAPTAKAGSNDDPPPALPSTLANLSN